MSTSKPNSNKPLIILQTSFIVSVICALSLGAVFSLSKGHSFNQFLYLSYLFFVNNLLMPISIASIIYYFLDKDHKMGKGIIGKCKTLAFLTLISLLLLIVWNIIDFVFHYHLVQPFSYDAVMEDLQQDLMVGAFLAIPVSCLVSLIYTFMDSRA